jgi:hypothetical protein
MPKSILTANHHANFMKFKFLKSQGDYLELELEKIYNTEKVRPLFNIPSCALIASKSSSGKKHSVPMLLFSGLLPSRNEHWNSAKSYLSMKETTYLPRDADTRSVNHYHRLFFEGATMFPRNFWFISFESDPVFGFNYDLPYVKSDKNNKSKSPWDKIKLEGNIESIFLYATIIGSDLLPFSYKRVRPIVMPLLIKDNKFAMMQSSDLAYDEGYTNMAQYMKQAEAAWESNATRNEDDALKIESPYIRLDYPQKNLTRQTPVGKFKVLFVAAATYMARSLKFAVREDPNYQQVIERAHHDKIDPNVLMRGSELVYLEKNNGENMSLL